jgi:hypothetical protein
MLPPVRRGQPSFGLYLGLAAAWLGIFGASVSGAQEAGGDQVFGAEPGTAPKAIVSPPAPAGADEIIADPELSAVPSSAGSAGADEVIADPELGAEPAFSEPRAEPNGEAHVVLHSRLGMDTQWQDPREDVWEATQIALFEARIRRSESLRFALGLRARYFLGARTQAAPDSSATHYELDVAPAAAYADWTVADGVHLRLGYQGVRLGRFDVLNPSDILSVYDLRSGPTTLPEANEIAQPAARIDWDIGSWFSLTAIVLPFFEPNLVHVTAGDYSLSPLHQADIDRQFHVSFGDRASKVQALARRTLSRSGQDKLTDGALAAFAPAPSFKEPQAALRLSAHGTLGEAALTAGVAREHLPLPVISPELAAFLDNPVTSEAAYNSLLGSTPAALRYDRYELVSADAATALGPVQLGIELAYMWNRALLASPPGVAPGAMPVFSEQIDIPDHSDIAHLGVRGEYVQGTTWVVTIEASAERAMQQPTFTNYSYRFLDGGRWLLSTVGFLAFSPGDIGLTLEVGAGVLSGPTYLIAPRVDQRVTDGLYVEAGAYFVGGQHRPPGDPAQTLGALYGGVDQVFVGLRWLP